MNKSLRKDADYIIKQAISAAIPTNAVVKALKDKPFNTAEAGKTGRLVVIAIGKAAFEMAKAAQSVLKRPIYKGIVITKYEHVKGEIPGIECCEAGHPVLDENTIKATEKAIEAVSGLTENDIVLFLVSGGGSALFEKPKISLDELQNINQALLKSGADITEINCIRKRLSYVKGGRFAELAKPAKVYSIVLSDVLGDKLDVIASGPAYPDGYTVKDAKEIVAKYDLKVSDEVIKYLEEETPKHLDNVETEIIGSVGILCNAAKAAAEELGYKTEILTETLDCEAKDAGVFLSQKAKEISENAKNISLSKDNNAEDVAKKAIILGGETVVKVKGTGLGGRNQELALYASKGLAGNLNAAVFSVGSDGTDGPTDAAGGYTDGDTLRELTERGIDIDAILENNDAYHALEKVGGLIITGPTGTNVNDISVLLVKQKGEASY